VIEGTEVGCNVSYANLRSNWLQESDLTDSCGDLGDVTSCQECEDDVFGGRCTCWEYWGELVRKIAPSVMKLTKMRMKVERRDNCLECYLYCSNKA
jgi:hypothetical protein